MNDNIFNKVYNPDVLSCLANLSNDEVFTPPEIVNQMLDMLPQELFKNPDTTFLDPACKTGVFLREIAKRLLKGLEPQFPDLQERIDHIFHKQLFGIAITELTSLLSRRSVYCSKYPNSDFSVTRFNTADGNIRFKLINHTWVNGRCKYCGANKVYDRDIDLETHAYEFIHIDNLEKLFNMKFDVIIGNPPYHLSDGGNGSSASPIYQKFIVQAKKLNPRYLTMIIPSRWFSGGKGLDDFRNDMLTDNRIAYICDYFDAAECFPGIDLSGGVCYFLWDKNNKGDCIVKSYINGVKNTMKRPLLENNCETFIRFNQGISIYRKVKLFNEPTFDSIVSSRKPFGITTTVKPKNNGDFFIYAYPQNGYIDKKEIICNFDYIYKYKVLTAKAYGERGNFPYMMIGKPFLAEPNSVCSETYLVISPSNKKTICDNVITYMKTKFFRFFVLFLKNTQNAAKNVYSLVPLQDFSKPWTDKELYAKYNLSQEEIDFIESMIKPME